MKFRLEDLAHNRRRAQLGSTQLLDIPKKGTIIPYLGM